MGADNQPVTVMEPMALAQMAAGEINAQVLTAKQFPRVLSQVRERIFALAASDKETAEKCWYALPRAGKVIEGPSIRLAEIVACSYQNLRAAARPIGITPTTVRCQAVCHDLENNVAISTEVERRIVDKNGKRFSDDMIIVTTNAGCSIALRNAVFKVVPGALFKQIMDKVKKVGMGEERAFAETRKAIVERLISLGGTREEICDLVSVRSVNDMDVDRVGTLQGLLNAIDEGSATAKEIFGTKPSKNAKPEVEEPTRKAKGKAAAKPKKDTEKPDVAATNKEPEPKEEKPMTEAEFAKGISGVMSRLQEYGITKDQYEFELVKGGFNADPMKANQDQYDKILRRLKDMMGEA